MTKYHTARDPKTGQFVRVSHKREDAAALWFLGISMIACTVAIVSLLYMLFLQQAAPTYIVIPEEELIGSEEAVGPLVPIEPIIVVPEPKKETAAEPIRIYRGSKVQLIN